MAGLKMKTYEMSRLDFFKAALDRAERSLDWAVKHSADWNVCAEKGEVVSYYKDAVEMFGKSREEKRRKLVWLFKNALVAYCSMDDAAMAEEEFLADFIMSDIAAFLEKEEHI